MILKHTVIEVMQVETTRTEEGQPDRNALVKVERDHYEVINHQKMQHHENAGVEATYYNIIRRGAKLKLDLIADKPTWLRGEQERERVEYDARLADALELRRRQVERERLTAEESPRPASRTNPPA